MQLQNFATARKQLFGRQQLEQVQAPQKTGKHSRPVGRSKNPRPAQERRQGLRFHTVQFEARWLANELVVKILGQGQEILTAQAHGDWCPWTVLEHHHTAFEVDHNAKLFNDWPSHHQFASHP